MCSSFPKLLLVLLLVGSLALVHAETDDDDPEDEHDENDHEDAVHWSYTGDHGTDHWKEMYDECGDQRQSPIDIQEDDVIPADFNKISLKYYFSKPKQMMLKNNGHSVVLTVEQNLMPWVTGGGYKDDFQFSQLHFHWGSDPTQGSEHTVDGHSAPLEMHIVHFNKKYNSIENVTTSEKKPVDGLAVLGVMFELQDEDNADLEVLLDNLDEVTDANTETTIDEDDVFPIGTLLPDDLNDFYYYSGSLTTPGCFEIVSWTVFSDKVPISRSQLSHFRGLHQQDSHRLEDNFRPSQPHNGRNVYHRSVFHQPSARDDEQDGGHAHNKHHKEWSYEGHTGPQNWAEMYDTCGGQRQSPVDIDTNEVIKAEMDPIVFKNYLERPTNMAVENNGHTAQLDITIRKNKTPAVTGGALKDVFNFLQLHFHWGSESEVGSEHTLNGQSAPLEMHLVHYNKKYGNASNAIAKRAADGLAVIGIMFEISHEDNPALEKLIDALDRIKKPTNMTMIKEIFTLGSLLPHDTSKFYSYEGSLTTPGCYEIVLWTVLSDRVPISNKQMEHFRNLETHHDHAMVNNYRPVQDHHGRRVMVRHVPPPPQPPTTAGADTFIVNFFWSLLVLVVAVLF